MAGINSPNNLNGINPLAYIGTTASGPLSPPSLSIEPRDPKSTPFGDYKNWNLGALWLNQTTEAFWVLVAKGANFGTWVEFTGGSGTMLTLTGNTEGPVSPLAGNINVVGDGIGITITGNPATHTLTASIIGTTVVNSIAAGENINLGGTAAAPIINLDETIHWPNTTADGLHGAIYLAATCTGTVCSGGLLFMHDYGPSAGSNTFLGLGAGNLTNTATVTTGVGRGALTNLGAGTALFAFGSGALASYNTTTGGIGCVAIGNNVLGLVTDTSHAVGIGAQALFSATAAGASDTVAIGHIAGYFITSGTKNCFIGSSSAANSIAVTGITTGSYNTFLGYGNGLNLTGAESSNIYLGASILGTTGESNVLRIGSATGSAASQIARTYLAGIAGVTTTVADAVPVLISSSTGQLGVTSSSIRYKENIKDLTESKEIYSLNPVIFNYKKHAPESKSVGLIAEEVHKIMPQLVIYKDNEPETVKYNDLIVYLLAEIQKLEKRIALLEK
jgi:hypothetical protein